MLRRLRSGQSRVDQPHQRAARRRPRRRRRASSSVTPSVPVRGENVCPSIQRRTVFDELGDEQRLVVVGRVRVGQRVQRAEDGGAGAHVLGEAARPSSRQPFVTPMKASSRCTWPEADGASKRRADLARPPRRRRATHAAARLPTSRSGARPRRGAALGDQRVQPVPAAEILDLAQQGVERRPRRRRPEVRRASPAAAPGSRSPSAASRAGRPAARGSPPSWPPRTPGRARRRTARRRAAAHRAPDTGPARRRTRCAPDRGTAAAAETRPRSARTPAPDFTARSDVRRAPPPGRARRTSARPAGAAADLGREQQRQRSAARRTRLPRCRERGRAGAGGGRTRAPPRWPRCRSARAPASRASRS